MHQVIYVSAATQLFSKAELLQLLTLVREKNQRLAVTGMLLYKDGDFIQLLEGEESVVKQVLDKIKVDRRHRYVTVILENDVESRLFPDWSMGFRDLSDPDLKEIPGFSNFLNASQPSEYALNDPNGCLELLSMFKPNSRGGN